MTFRESFTEAFRSMFDPESVGVCAAVALMVVVGCVFFGCIFGAIVWVVS